MWQGANWTYIIWGTLNGFYLVFAIWTKEMREKIASYIPLFKYKKVRKIWQVGITFSLICFAWIFFRAKNVSEAFYIITHLTSGMENILSLKYIVESIATVGISKSEFIISISVILFMEFIHLIQRHYKIRHMLSEKSVWVRWAIYFIIVYGTILFGIFGKNDFIYFQF